VYIVAISRKFLLSFKGLILIYKNVDKSVEKLVSLNYFCLLKPLITNNNNVSLKGSLLYFHKSMDLWTMPLKFKGIGGLL